MTRQLLTLTFNFGKTTTTRNLGQQKNDGQESKQRKQWKMIGGTMRQEVVSGDMPKVMTLCHYSSL